MNEQLLYKFSSIRLKKKRMIKKFNKAFNKYVPSRIFREYLAKIMCMPIRRSLNYESIGRKLFGIEQLDCGKKHGEIGEIAYFDANYLNYEEFD